MLIEAAAPERVTGLSKFEPSIANWTLPVGIRLVFVCGEILAVIVISWFSVVGLFGVVRVAMLR